MIIFGGKTKKIIVTMLLLVLCYLQAPEITATASAAASDNSWVKQIGIMKEQNLILKSNGDLMKEENGKLTKVAGNIKNFSLGQGYYNTETLIAVRENGTLYSEGSVEIYKSNKIDLSSLKNVHMVSQDHGELMYINNNRELYEYKSDETPKKVMDNVVDIKQGYGYYLALTADGELWSGGDSHNQGQLGTETFDPNGFPQKVMENVREIAAYESTSLAITEDGTLWGWGINRLLRSNYALLLNEDEYNFNKPELIMKGAKHVSLAEYGVMVIKENNELWGWGKNVSGEIGNDTKNATMKPVLVLDKVKQASIRSEYVFNYPRTIVVRENGEIWGWGDLTNGSSLVPKKIMGAQSSSTATPTGQFKNASAWAIPELSKADSKGLLSPVLNYDFNKPITREKFSEMVLGYYEALTGTTVESSALNPFTDTVNKKVLKAYSLGIVLGKSEDKFKPNDLITREEISVMLKRALDKGKPQFDYNYQYKRFEDENKFSDWSTTAIKYLRSLDVIQGDSNNNFNPKANTTIQEASIMTYRLLEKTE
ncbi:S-layer homology domain-containing protein [Paenibacillus hubeiensis]|uniref:S-layer homology domain-containing protein n=1 Tax=Paenibacillus hubeiensis TaxID=3077330 RepID=UPI0031BA3F66